MKITFVGNFEVPYSSENHHASSLETLGHEVIRLQEGKTSGEQILEVAFDCDILVFVHTHGWETPGVSIDTVFRLLKKSGIPVITYHLDLWFGLQRQKDIEQDPFYKQLDYFFATDKLMTDWFTANTSVEGVYLPAGVYDEEAYLSPFYNPDYFDRDVIFVGSKGYHPEWPYRPQLIDNLRNQYGDKFTHVGGDGDTGTVRGQDLNNIYANSKIAVGDTLCIGFDYPYYWSDRLYESTGRGGFTIFPYIKGIEDSFEIGKEIVVYTYGDYQELFDKINYYLEHDVEREAIRVAGQARTKKDHTYLNRWSVIIDRITDDQNKTK